MVKSEIEFIKILENKWLLKKVQFGNITKNGMTMSKLTTGPCIMQ